MTRIGSAPVHIEFFKSREDLIEEKSYLARALKAGGTLILNADDEDILAMKKYSKGKVITVAYEQDAGEKKADLVASHDSIYYEKNMKGEDVLAGITFKVNFENNSVPVVRKGVLGIQHIFPTLCALAVGISQGLNIVDVYPVLSESSSAPGRMRLLAGVKGSFIIDDTYNSSPVALEAALQALKNVKVKGKKIAVLGDMMELGKQSTAEHEKAGLEVAKIADVLVTVGVRSRSIVQGALDGGMDELKIQQFDKAGEAGEFVAAKIKEGDIVLFKGSQSTRMERAVKGVMVNPEDAEALLVRQDVEWQTR
jgi:UDP-N-acetylmuramoyl-tripeptide--D-alanyl-D-alanine ligase